MGPSHKPASFLRVFGVWLVLVSVAVGPFGMETAAAADTGASDAPCPCDEARHAEHAEPEDPADDGCGHGEGSAQDAESGEAPCNEGEPCGDDEPCGEECPDGCPDCSCCPASPAAVVSLLSCTMPGCPVSSTWIAAPEARATGTTVGVFRPPRSLT